jgi:inward rectifier potassium channel
LGKAAANPKSQSRIHSAMNSPPAWTSSQPNPFERPLDRDLGFGSLALRSHYRLLNPDGSFNVRRLHEERLDKLFGYQSLINLSWMRFFVIFSVWYMTINAVFALGYLSLGPDALQGWYAGPLFWRAFFFSIHTFATVGYGNIVPVTFLANALAALQTLTSLLSLAVATGLVFARFSRPNARMRYSRSALIAPYRDLASFQFRIVNGRRSQLFNVQALVMHSRFETIEGTRVRRFYPMDLERNFVAVFPANWTIVHPISPQSPIFGWTQKQLLEAEAEFLVLLNAVDETYSQTVYSRSSYSAHQVEWGRKFAMMFFEDGNQAVLDLERLNDTVAAPLSTGV